MSKPKRNDLSNYVSRIMKLKALSPRDVAEKSGDQITGAYVTSMMSGVASNPSVEKLNALATGLGVDAVELFEVASGLSQKTTADESVDTSHTLMILEMMQKIAASPEATELVQEVLRLNPHEQKIILRTLSGINTDKPRLRRAKDGR
jgi:transcriptional regulator with XRE-family HTH domain